MNRRKFMGICATSTLLGLIGKNDVAWGQNAPSHADINELLSEFEVPGISYAMMRGGTIVHSDAQGLASLKTGAPVTATSVFEAASLTKALFAQVALQLAQEG